MRDEIKQHLEDAKNCLRQDPIEENYYISSGMSNQFFRHIYNLIDELSFDLQEKKVTKRHVANGIAEFLKELAEETHGQEKGIIEAFAEQKEEFLGDLFGGPINTYKFAFPLNLCENSYPHDQIDSNVKKLDYNEWENKYYELALDKDDTHFEKFLRESPNNLRKYRRRNSRFTYWITEYDAREPEYALEKVIRFLRLTLAKVNYALYKKTINRTTSSNSPPATQLSRIQEPFFYLAFQDDNYLFYQPMDYDYRRSCANPDPDDFDTIEALPDLSIEDLEPEDKESVDDSLIKALFAYQDGIVSSNPRQSFFAFWRGMENLTQADRGEKGEIVDRARAVHDFEGEEPVRLSITEALDELGRIRNQVAHEGPHVSVSWSHRAAAKVLLESLLSLYFEIYDRDYDLYDYRVFLQQLAKQHDNGSDDLDQKKAKVKTIERDIEIIEDMREYQEKKYD